MDNKLIEYITNPAKSRLLTAIGAQGQTTAKELAKTVDGIPQATLYRYLKKMVEDGVLEIAEERQVRNVREKVYRVAIDLNAEIGKMVAENSGEWYLSVFRQFSNGLVDEFQKYAARDDINIAKDGSGFRIMPFYATYAELEELALQMWELTKPYYENASTPERQLRNVAIIFTPPGT